MAHFLRYPIPIWISYNFILSFIWFDSLFIVKDVFLCIPLGTGWHDATIGYRFEWMLYILRVGVWMRYIIILLFWFLESHSSFIIEFMSFISTYITSNRINSCPFQLLFCFYFFFIFYVASSLFYHNCYCFWSNASKYDYRFAYSNSWASIAEHSS